MNEQEFAELAAGYALHALSPDDLARFEAARAQHPEWEELVGADAATAAALSDTVRDVSPPEELRARVLAQVAALPQDESAAVVDGIAVPPRPPAPSPVEPREPAPDTAMIQAVSRRNWTRGLFGLAASLVLLVALGFGAVTLNEYLSRTPATIALAEIEDAADMRSATADLSGGGTATAYWSDELGKAVFVSDSLPAIADDQSFELWLVRDGDPISVGVYDPPRGREATVLLDDAVQAGDVIAITVEPEGGSPEGVPTTDPIAAIPTA
ncbi:anti-sigma factor [Microbacterium aureliae]